jgi:glycosyltransferase involved in cell wall biosynthesis
MPGRLNLALVNSLYPPIAVGGAEKVVQSLAEALTRSDHRVSVITLSQDPVGKVERIHGVTVIRLPTDVPWPFGTGYKSVAKRVRIKLKDHYSVTMYERVRTVLDELKPDIVHTNSLMGFSVSAWNAAGSLDLPIIHTAHDWYLLCIRSTMLRGRRPCVGQCSSCAFYTGRRKLSSARVGAFVGVSAFVRDTHLRCGFFGAAALKSVLHNPHPLRQPNAGRLSRHTGPLRLGYLGRLESAKGIEVLLAAIRPLEIELEVHIGGTGNATYIDDLKARYPDGRWVWHGQVNPQDFFARIDVLVVPSLWHEPFGLVIGEAHSHGIPVVAARRGGIPEIVREGLTGLLFDPERPEELGEIVTRLAKDKTLIAEMSSHIMAQAPGLGVEAWANSYANLYAELREARPSAPGGGAWRQGSPRPQEPRVL